LSENYKQKIYWKGGDKMIIGGLMKKEQVCILMVLVLVVLMDSCVSTQDKTMLPEERTSAEVIGRVETKFLAVQPLHIVFNENIAKKAYAKLMAEARREYQGNIEVVNITVEGAYNLLTILPLPFIYGIIGNFQTVTASGDVIVYGSGGRSVADVEGALTRAADLTLKNVPQRSKIAIVYITAQDRGTTEYIAGELEFIWVNDGYTIIDRSQLDRLRREQNFQMSGEVDDETAVSIGKFAGADIIVTGRVDGDGNLRRLRLRALDTQTAQVFGVSSERF
jgi:hypothetical protein